MQGSSAFSQSALWAPSRVPDAVSRELPMEMEDAQIDALVDGFAAAAALAAGSGLDGVEINAGQHSLLRQFQSGLTNQRGDDYGQDRLLLTERVLRAVRDALGTGPGARAAAVLRRAGPLGGGDPRNGRRAGRAASRAGGLSRGGARVDLLGAGDPSRPAFRAGLGHRAVPAGPGRGGRRHPGGRAGQRGGPGAGAVGAERRGRRSGRDDQGADHRSRPGRAAAPRRGGTNPPLPAVQPGLHGPGQPESGHHLRHRAQQRP